MLETKQAALRERLSRLLPWLHARRGAIAGLGAGIVGGILVMLLGAAIFEGGLSDSAPPPPQAIFIELE